MQWAGLYMRKLLCKVKRKVEGVCIYDKLYCFASG